MLPCDGFVVVVNQKAEIPLGPAFVGIHEVLLKSGDDLLKGLLVN